MSRCRAESFYISPTDKRSFDQWDVFAVLPNGDKVPIGHRKDVRRIELNHPGWDGQTIVVSKTDDSIVHPVVMNANTVEGKRLLDSKAAAKMALSLADPSQKGEIGLTAKQVAHGLFGDPAAGGAGNAPVIKMVGQLMTQTDNWSAAVEMLSFVSGASALLDPGRTQQLLEFCASHTNRAWAPLSEEDWKIATSVLEQYPPVVRLRLLKDLWEVSHGPSWYDVENPAKYADYDYEEHEDWQDREDRLRWEEEKRIGEQFRTDPDTDATNPLPLLLAPQHLSAAEGREQFLLDKWVIWRENFLTNCGPSAGSYLWEGVDVEFDSQNRVISWDLATANSAELFYATDLSTLTSWQVDDYIGTRRYYGTETLPGYLWALHPGFAELDDDHPALCIQQDILRKCAGSDFVQDDYLDIVPKWVYGQLLSQGNVDFYDSALISIVQKYPNLIYQVSPEHAAHAFRGVAYAMANDPAVDASIDLEKLAPMLGHDLQWCARNAATTPKLREFFLSTNDTSVLAALIESGSFEPTPTQVTSVLSTFPMKSSAWVDVDSILKNAGDNGWECLPAAAQAYWKSYAKDPGTYSLYALKIATYAKDKDLALTIFDSLPPTSYSQCDPEFLHLLPKQKVKAAFSKATDPHAVEKMGMMGTFASFEIPTGPISKLLSEAAEAAAAHPDKPKRWQELLSAGSVSATDRYKYADSRPVWKEKTLPGFEDLTAEPLLTNLELRRNADDMGNCTYSYKHNLSEGTEVMYRITDGDGRPYNAHFLRQNDNTWAVGEVNSKHNRGRVPAEITKAADTIANLLRKGTPSRKKKKAAAESWDPVPSPLPYQGLDLEDQVPARTKRRRGRRGGDTTG